jgi:hypothetical protein
MQAIVLIGQVQSGFNGKHTTNTLWQGPFDPKTQRLQTGSDGLIDGVVDWDDVLEAVDDRDRVGERVSEAHNPGVSDPSNASSVSHRRNIIQRGGRFAAGFKSM